MHPLSDEDDIAEAGDEADKHAGDTIVTRYIQDNNVTTARLSFAALSNCWTICRQEQKGLQLIIWFWWFKVD